MKVRIYGTHWLHLDLIAESAGELRELRKLYKAGHLHLVCKALGPMDLDEKVVKGQTRLMLEPSIVKWQRPKVNRVGGGSDG